MRVKVNSLNKLVFSMVKIVQKGVECLTGGNIMLLLSTADT